LLLSCTLQKRLQNKLQKRLQNKLQKRLQKINKSQHHTFHQEYTSEVFALQLQKTFVMMMTLNGTLQTFSATSHLSCLAHVIQLAVKQLLKLLMLSSKNENEKKYWILKISLQSMSVQESLSRTLFKIINNFYLSCYFTLQLFLQSILQSILQSLSEIQSKLLFMTL